MEFLTGRKCKRATCKIRTMAHGEARVERGSISHVRFRYQDKQALRAVGFPGNAKDSCNFSAHQFLFSQATYASWFFRCGKGWGRRGGGKWIGCDARYVLMADSTLRRRGRGE
jgi:hypothetical protein